MIDLILDTNILIYLFNKEEKYVSYLESLGNKSLGISVVSYMEVLMGLSNDDVSMFSAWMDAVEIVPLSVEIAYRASGILKERKRKNLKDPRLADVLIGCTAVHLAVPLVTNNAKDFRVCSDLSIIVP